MSDARRWAPSVVWAGLILVATSLPASTLPSAPVFPGADKVVHFVFYGVLGALVAHADTGRARPSRGVPRLIGMIAIFALIDEVHQRWIPGRSMEFADWMADVTGALVGITLTRAALRRRETIT